MLHPWISSREEWNNPRFTGLERGGGFYLTIPHHDNGLQMHGMGCVCGLLESSRGLTPDLFAR